MWFARFPPNISAGWALTLGGTVWMAEDGSEACAYLQQAPALSVPPEASLVRLEQTLVLAGEAQGRDSPWHYVVATDVLPADAADFNAWYDTEHLAGLAAVPGVALAMRCKVVEGTGPQYHAGYDLADRSACNGPAWLAVRGSPWSSRVRPSFLNSRRTMYHRLA
jgi:hypothetical protein